jgi:hypothetical protein
MPRATKAAPIAINANSPRRWRRFAMLARTTIPNLTGNG